MLFLLVIDQLFILFIFHLLKHPTFPTEMSSAFDGLIRKWQFFDRMCHAQLFKHNFRMFLCCSFLVCFCSSFRFDRRHAIKEFFQYFFNHSLWVGIWWWCVYMPIVTITCFVQSCQQKTLMRCASKIERIRIHCQVRECWLRAVNQKAITHNWDKLRWRGNGRAWRPTCRALRAGPARGRDSKWILRTRSVRRRRRTPTSTVTRAVCPAGNRWNCTSAPNCWPPCDPAGTDPGTWRVLAAAATNRGPMWVRVRGVTWRAVSPRYRHRKGPLTTSSSNPWSCWLGNFSYTILPTPKLHDVWAAGRTHTHTHTHAKKRPFRRFFPVPSR